MRARYSLLHILALPLLACGGSGNSDVDSSIHAIDGHGGSGSGIDAGSSGGHGDFGKICTGSGSGDPSACSADDPECLTLTGNAFYCTASCGTGPCVAGGTAGSDSCFGSGSNQPAAPANGDAACQALSAAGGTGTPVCGVFGPGSGSGNSAVAWSCILLCGTAGSDNLGTCPTGLTCTQNACI